MKRPIFVSLIMPQWNRYMSYGVVGTILGVLFTPMLIGLPIIGLGFGLFSIGVMVSIAEKFPKGKWLVTQYEIMFRRMFSFIRSLLSEVIH